MPWVLRGLRDGVVTTGYPRRPDPYAEAAAIFEVDMLPGNMRYQGYPSNTKAPAFIVEHSPKETV